MKIACQLLAWGSNLQEGLVEVSKADYRYIEIGSKIILKFEKKLEEWNLLLNQYNLKVSAVFEFGHFSLWDKRREIYFHHERLARLLYRSNITQIILAPGLKLRSNPGLDLIIKMAEEIYSRYAMYGIRVGIHPHYAQCISSLDEIKLFMEHVSSPIFLVPDLGHMALSEVDWKILFTKFLDKITCIHLKDAKIDYSNTALRLMHCKIGEGELGVEEFIQQLKEIGYCEWLTIEPEIWTPSIGEDLLKVKNFVS